jgi:hypothetical protein
MAFHGNQADMPSLIKRYLIYSFIIFLILILSSPFIIIKAVNTSYVKNKMSAAILKKTGADIDVSKISFTLSPKPCLTVENFNFNPDSKIGINIKAINFSIDFQKIFSGQISITQISIIRPEIELSRIKSPGIKSPVTKLEGTKKQQDSSILNFAVPISQIIPEIKKIFDYLPSHQDSIEFEFENFISPYFKRMDGSFYISKKTNKILLNMVIQDLSLQSSKIFGDEFKKINLEFININQIECTVSFDAAQKINGKVKLSDLLFKSKNNISLFNSNHLGLDFKISDNLYQLDIKPFQAAYPQGAVAIHFKDDHVQNQTQLQFTGTDINIEQAREMTLLLIEDEMVTKNIFDILNGGLASQINVSFLGKNLKDLFNEKSYTLSGKIKNGLVSIPGTNLKAAAIEGDAGIEKGVLNINTKKGIIQGSKIKKGTLSIDLANYVDFPFYGAFELDIDLARIPQTLTSLLPDNLLTKELLLVHDITGRAEIRLNLSMKTQSDDLEVQINTDDFAVTGFYDRIPWEIDLKTINFIYESDMVHLKNVNGIVNNSTFENFEVFFDFKNETIINIISGSGVFNPDPIMPWLMSFKKINDLIFPVKKIDGNIHIESIQLSGPLLESDKWQYDILGIGVGIDISTDLNQKEIENLSCNYHISNGFLNLDQISLKMEHLSWLEPFIETKYLQSIMLPINMNKGKLQIKPESSFLNGDLEFNTGPRIFIDLSGKTFESLKLNSIKFQDQELSKGSIAFDYDKDNPFFNFNGFLNTTTLNKFIKPHTLVGKKLNTLTQNQPILISVDKDLKINISSKTIDLSAFNSQSNNISFSSSSHYDQLFAKPIIIKTDKLKTKKFTFTNVETQIVFKKNGTDIKINHAFLCDLETSGFINFKKNSVDLKLPIKADNKTNIQNLLSCLFQNNEFMDGNYSLTGNIVAKSAKKNVLNKINGSMQLIAKHGRIHELTLLSRILSVVNISKIFKGSIPDITQTGFKYNKIIIEANITDSIIHLSKAIVDGVDMTLIFEGKIDPFNDNINLTCLVAPFKTIDLIIENIPIINTLLDDRLVSIPAKINGKFSDPTVTPLHPSAVGTSLIDMISNILKTPVKLWNKIYDE